MQELVKESFFCGERKSGCLQTKTLDIDTIVLTFISTKRRDRVSAECMQPTDRRPQLGPGGERAPTLRLRPLESRAIRQATRSEDMNYWTHRYSLPPMLALRSGDALQVCGE